MRQNNDKSYIAKVPLRICPLGAHVDHQGGVVTGMPIDKSIDLHFTLREDTKIVISSSQFGENQKYEFDLNSIPKAEPKNWANYAQGAAEALTDKYELTKGFTGHIEGDMPVGGLSSSAAVGVAYLLALEKVNELKVTTEDNILLDKHIENNYLGLKNGILDQSIILKGGKDQLTYLDCSTTTFKDIQTKNNDFEILIAYSGLSESKGLVGTDYNNRVVECKSAASKLLEYANITTKDEPILSDVPEDIYEKYKNKLSDKEQLRAKHYFSECKRVEEGIKAWRSGDLESFGKLINESGQSSISNYECGSPHLISLYKILKDIDGVYGTRFSGAGFRGSTIAFIKPGSFGNIKEVIESKYPKLHPDITDTYSVHLANPGDAPKVIEA